MGLMHEVRREFIAVPDTHKGQIVYKWPDENIRKFTRAIVEPDAVAVFMSQGQVMGVVPPGQHTLDARELPFLGLFVDWASGGDAFKAELYFVGTREYPNNRFGGRLDDVQDPVTGLIVTLRAFGEYSLKVNDPTKLILNLTGTVDVSNNDAITGWVAEQLLKVTRTTVTTQLMSGAWPILGLSSHSPDIEAAAMPAADAQLENYGVTICRLGNLDVYQTHGRPLRIGASITATIDHDAVAPDVHPGLPACDSTSGDSARSLSWLASQGFFWSRSIRRCMAM